VAPPIAAVYAQAMTEEAPPARVLLVDDAGDDVAMYRQFLESRGYAVDSAADGEEAVSRAVNGSFDVVVLDLGLPRLDGMQVLMLLRSYSSTRLIPVITLSARTGEVVRTAAVDAGADLALEKPCTPDELETAIRVFLKRGERLRNATKVSV